MNLLNAVLLSMGVSALLIHCSNGNLAGGTTETGNPQAVASLTGTVVDSSNAPVASALVRCVSVSHNPLKQTAVHEITATTGSDGKFEIAAASGDSYTLEVAPPDNSFAALMCDVEIKSGETSKNAGEIALAPKQPMILVLDDDAYIAQTAFYIPGTGYYAHVDTSKVAVFSSIGAHEISLVYYHVAKDSTIATISNISVRDTVRVRQSSGGSVSSGISVGAF